LALHLKAIQFYKTPAEQCFKRLAESAGVSVRPDWERLNARGLFQDTPITVVVAEMPVGDALRRVLTSLPNEMVADTIDVAESGGVVRVGVELPQEMVVRAYDISWVDFAKFGGNDSVDFIQVSKAPGATRAQVLSYDLYLLLDTYVKSSNEFRGGRYDSWMVPFGKRLLVRDTPQVQLAVSDFLNSMSGAILHAEPTAGASPGRDRNDEARHRVLPEARFEAEPFARVISTLERASHVSIHVHGIDFGCFPT
jgi:hypothetical protein